MHAHMGPSVQRKRAQYLSLSSDAEILQFLPRKAECSTCDLQNIAKRRKAISLTLSSLRSVCTGDHHDDLSMEMLHTTQLATARSTSSDNVRWELDGHCLERAPEICLTHLITFCVDSPL